MVVKVGVLALQGAFAKHCEMLSKIGALPQEVRKASDLDSCSGLIIPGGESTTIWRSIHFSQMYEKISEFGKTKPIFGTCAGLILMSKKVLGDSFKPFGFLNIEVERNAFGRQAESFRTELTVQIDTKQTKTVPALFIRAPRIRAVGEDVEILAQYEDEPVLVRQGLYLGSTFHTELSSDSSIHELFLTLIQKK